MINQSTQMKIKEIINRSISHLELILFEYKLFQKLDRWNWGYLVNYLRYGIIGDRVRLEASSVCQLKCPLCPTGMGINKKGVVGWGFLNLENFKKFVDENPKIKNVEISNYGEIFLNPLLGEILRYAYEKGISLSAGTGANFNFIREDILEALVKYQFKRFNIALDGASQETYQIYRKGGDFNNVINNIKRLNYYKEKYNSKFPIITWQFVIFGHNEHELPKAREMAEELNMKFVPKANWDSSFSPVKDKETVLKESGIDVSKTHEPWCYQLWKSPQINWDGKLLGCCVNIWSDFGNVFENGLEKSLKSEKYRYAKEMLLGLKPPREDIPCLKCPVYKSGVFKKEVSKILGEKA